MNNILSILQDAFYPLQVEEMQAVPGLNVRSVYNYQIIAFINNVDQVGIEISGRAIESICNKKELNYLITKVKKQIGYAIQRNIISTYLKEISENDIISMLGYHIRADSLCTKDKQIQIMHPNDFAQTEIQFRKIPPKE